MKTKICVMSLLTHTDPASQFDTHVNRGLITQFNVYQHSVEQSFADDHCLPLFSNIYEQDIDVYAFPVADL